MLIFIPSWDIWHGGHFMEATKDSDIVWEYEDPMHNHDAQWLDGGLLYVVLEYKDGRYSDIVKMVNPKVKLYGNGVHGNILQKKSFQSCRILIIIGL